MRVLHVIPDLSRAFGGPTSALLGFLAASRAAGIDAAVAAPSPSDEDLDWFRRQAGETEVHVYPTRWRGSARVAPGIVDYLRVQAGSFDAVHIHGMFNGISTSAARAARGASLPYVIGPFGTLSRYTFAHRRTLLKRAWHSLLDAPAVRRAGAMHFTTVHERDEARRLEAVRSVPSVVVPPAWIPHPSVAEPGAHGPSSTVSAQAGTVLFLGRLHPIKALEALIDAWPRVRASRPRARLLIAGSGDPEYERAIKARVVQSGSAGSIEFTGFVTGAEKSRLLTEADAFVLPSYHENFGMSVVEAITNGVPAVVSPDVQLAEVVAEHRLGAVVSRDPASLAEGILSVLGDPALRHRCATEGRAIMQSLFSPRTIGLQLRAMYELARSRPTVQE
jgi:glycosyltransferase involved in cell wall biosynthesis